jgi:hypothetical protein
VTRASHESKSATDRRPVVGVGTGARSSGLKLSPDSKSWIDGCGMPADPKARH